MKEKNKNNSFAILGLKDEEDPFKSYGFGIVAYF